MSSAGVIVLCGSLPTLTELDVGFCARVTDTAISTICKELPSLRKLSLQNCRAVTDEGISLLSQLSCLEDINLQGLERMTSLGKSVKRFSILSLHGLPLLVLKKVLNKDCCQDRIRYLKGLTLVRRESPKTPCAN